MLKPIFDAETESNPLSSTTEIIYNSILRAIFEGELQPGEKLSQIQLSQDLGISRTPVRDAMLRLKEDGYLTKDDSNSFKVYKIQLKDYVTFYEFRKSLEYLSAYLAARNINEEQLKKLQTNLQQYEKYMKTANRPELLKLDSEFHETIALSTLNNYLIEAFMKITKKAYFFRSITVGTSSANAIFVTHTAIYNAIAKRDEKAAVAAMKRDFSFYLKNIYNKI